jgi:hypothetical protein
MWKLILENFLNHKITEPWQKLWTCWIRKLHHFNLDSVPFGRLADLSFWSLSMFKCCPMKTNYLENKFELNWKGPLLLYSTWITSLLNRNCKFFYPADPRTFFFHVLKKKKKKNLVGQNGYVACLCPRSIQHQAYCHIFKRIFACRCLSWDSQTCLPWPTQCRQQKWISLLLSETSETQLEVRTSHYIFPNNWGGKIFLAILP